LTPDMTRVSFPETRAALMANHHLQTRRSTLSQSRTLFIGMDVHKDAMAVASVAQDHGADVPSLGAIGTRQCAIDPLLRTRPSKATHLVFVAEAGPGGAWLSRYLTNKGDACRVVAPSLIPQKPGDRVKTDRRDAGPLARLARAGARTAVSVPKGEDAALRDLTRAREDTMSALKDAQLRRKAVVLRQAIRDVGRAHGGPAPLRWLSAVVGPTPAQPIVFHDYIRAVHDHPERLQRLEQARHDPVQSWRVHPVVEALQALRGGPCTVAVTRVADIGDLTRVDHPRALMTCLGLIPSESTSAERRRQGSLTQAGLPMPDGRWLKAPGPPALPSRSVDIGT